MKATKDTGNIFVAALDPNDSVGVMDSYFPEADFFTEFKRFDRHVDKLRRKKNKVDLRRTARLRPPPRSGLVLQLIAPDDESVLR